MSIISAVVLLTQGDAIEAAVRDFSTLGFDTRVVAKRGLVITGDETLFADKFAVRLRVGDDGVWVVGGEKPSRVLSTGGLPRSLQACVEGIEFETPPDFGPTDY